MRLRFRIGRRTPSGICERCGTDEHVHRGLCRRCRALAGETLLHGEPGGRAPHQAESEPLHNPPWRRRGA